MQHPLEGQSSSKDSWEKLWPGSNLHFPDGCPLRTWVWVLGIRNTSHLRWEGRVSVPKSWEQTVTRSRSPWPLPSVFTCPLCSMGSTAERLRVKGSGTGVRALISRHRCVTLGKSIRICEFLFTQVCGGFLSTLLQSVNASLFLIGSTSWQL